jgi:hypothetical protein
MKIKFKTFCPCNKFDKIHGPYLCTATIALNDWLEENPNIEILSWQTTPVGTANELYITIQYRERED